jgi:hypothetical protein
MMWATEVMTGEQGKITGLSKTREFVPRGRKAKGGWPLGMAASSKLALVAFPAHLQLCHELKESRISAYPI